ncbi:MAG TPA: amidase, partial [Methylomirabilota bacterium]|nr:amidase [Methylomirabilota bacterium]
MAADLVWTSMTELARLIATKAVSPVEVVRAHLDRITTHDGSLKAYITVCGDRALDAARAAEAALTAGGALPPLHGVPYALKDLYDTAGLKTTGGSRIFAERVPATDATVVTRLAQAGVILLGKLNMVEFAYGPEGLNIHYGHARNPWGGDTHRLTGGSSSGAGAA